MPQGHAWLLLFRDLLKDLVLDTVMLIWKLCFISSFILTYGVENHIRHWPNKQSSCYFRINLVAGAFFFCLNGAVEAQTIIIHTLIISNAVHLNALDLRSFKILISLC